MKNLQVNRIDRVDQVCLVALLTTLLAAPALAQTRPPVLTSIAPYGLQQGTTVTFTVEGANLAGADRAVFDDAGLTATLGSLTDLGADIRKRTPGETGAIIQDKAEKGRLSVTITAAASAPTGRHGFRLHTPLGTTSFMAIWVGAEPEAVEREPNDEPDQAMPLSMPVTVNGSLEHEGDADCYRIDARAGRDLVVRIVAMPIGSMMDSKVTLLSPDGRELASNDDFNGSRDSLVVYRPQTDGPVIVRIADANAGGGWRNIYRATIGEVPVLTGVFPLGRRKGSAAPVHVDGANLDGHTVATVGTPLPDQPLAASANVAGLASEPINRVQVALGRYPEVMAGDRHRTMATALRVASPVTINGRLTHREGGADADWFRFTAAKGQTLAVQVNAARLGSALDSVVEILDARGRPVPRVRLRPVWETTVDLRNHGSQGNGIRLLAWNELRRGDYVYIDRELLRVDELPKGPDEDTFFQDFRGERISFEDTTAEGHALLRPVYKVELLPPGTPVAPNGLPVFDLVYRNDDGGPMFGKDSKLTFKAPAAGTYFVRLSDARGSGGPHHSYRLTIAPPAPDFDLSLSPSNPNVPRGGRVPVTVFAFRRDGFDGPIAVELKDLPAGISAAPGVILPGESGVSLTLTAAESVDDAMTRFTAVGRATIAGRTVEHHARPDEKVSVVSTATPPDVRVVSVSPDVVELAPGQRAKVTATIARANGFTGRVPLSVRNLPFRVTVPDIGLNGILITETQDNRTFEIVADDNAAPVEQTLFVTARVETNGGTNSEASSAPLRIRIVGRNAAK
jgi:hypothetical protein